MHTFIIVYAEIIIFFSLKLTWIGAIGLSIAHKKRPPVQTDGQKIFAAKVFALPFNGIV